MFSCGIGCHWLPAQDAVSISTLLALDITLQRNIQVENRQSIRRVSIVVPCHDDRWEMPENAHHVSAHVQVQQLQEKLSNAARSSSCSTSPLLRQQLAQLLQERDAILAHNHHLTGRPVTSASQHFVPLNRICWD